MVDEMGGETLVILGPICLLSAFGLTAGVIGELNRREDSDPGWLGDWWAFPALSVAVAVGTLIVGALFVMSAAAASTGHFFGTLVAIPYGLIALDSNIPSLSAALALPIAGFVMVANNGRYSHQRDMMRFGGRSSVG